MRVVLVAVVVMLSACPQVAAPPSDAGTGGGSAGGGAGGGGGSLNAPLQTELLPQLAGLWSGPGTMTPLGSFPLMTMDLRPVDSQFVFSQAELDPSDTLRFGFSIETYGGHDVLAFRNGGFFQGVLRDTRTQLVSQDGGTWEFCSVSMGCSYLDAKFTVANDTLTMDTHVRGAQHLLWNARRLETREVPAGFPTDLHSRGDGTAPWPAMSAVQVNANFGITTSAPADAWLILTTTACYPTFACHASRSISIALDAGVSGATLTLPTVHAGAYKATVLLDVDRNFASTFAPSHGDKVALDQDLVVTDGGVATLNVTTLITAP